MRLFGRKREGAGLIWMRAIREGRIALTEKRYEEATKCYDKASRIIPKDAYAWHYKGDALLNLKRYKEAIRCCDKALEINPNFEEAKNNKKTAEEKLKKEKEAGLLWKTPFIPKKSKIRGLLKKEDPSIALEKFSSDRDLIPTLIELLYDSNPKVRKGAAYNIGAIGANNPDLVKSAIPRLIKLLDDLDGDVRSQTANAIWLWLWLGGATPEWFKDAIPKLMNLLIDPSEDVRSNAAYALGQIGRKKPDLVESVIPRLIRFLDYPNARREVINVVMAIGEPNPDLVKDAFPKLINLLDDVHRHAMMDVYTFMRIGKKRPDLIEGIAPKLRNLLSDEQKIVSNAEVIGFLGQINLDLVKDVISKMKEFLNSSDKEVRKNAARAIAIIAKRKPELVKDAIPRLIELLGDPDVQWADSAIEEVAEKAPAFFKDVELEKLLNSSDKEARKNAVRAIATIAKRKPELVKDAIPRLIKLLDDLDVQGEAVSAITEIAKKNLN
jgi:HEAT repeat protein